jgi:lipopolysaccharide assembly outer membrane protein LptD (OstA)
MYSDKLDIFFLPETKDKTAGEGKEKKSTSPSMSPTAMASKINKIVATGNVKVIQGKNISYSDTATYNAVEKKLLLTGRPKLVIYSTEDLKIAPSGD